MARAQAGAESPSNRGAGALSGLGDAREGPVRLRFSSEDYRDRPVILYMHPGPAPMHHTPQLNMLFHLSAHLSGAAISGAWAKNWEEAQRWREKVEPACGGFLYQPVPYHDRGWQFFRPFVAVYMMYRAAIRMAHELPRPVEAVVGYSPYGMGFAAWLVSARLNAPLIVQVQNDLSQAFLGQPGRFQSLRKRVSSWLASFVLSRANAWQLYYPGQTGTLVPRKNQSVFHLANFTPVSAVPAPSAVTREFLMVGYPFAVKGVDVAIKAFREAGEALGDWSLRVIGHCTDLTPYLEMAGDDPRIKFDGPTLHVAALAAISNCGVFVLASRTEAIARVVLEAMAAGKPVIATDVGGIATLIEDDKTGLLIQPDDVKALSAAMLRLAGDAELRARLGDAARKRISESHTEAVWTERFAEMIQAVARGTR